MSNQIKKTGRGGKYNFPWTIDPEAGEPGDNSRFLMHAMAVRNMPPINYADPEQVRIRINEYFQLCAQDDIRPTATGFRIAVGISKQTLSEWRRGGRRGPEHQQVILEAYDMLEQMWEHYMMNGKINPVSGIFLGKNLFDYSDKQEYVVTPNAQPEPVDVKALEEKYAELPEVVDAED